MTVVLAGIAVALRSGAPVPAAAATSRTVTVTPGHGVSGAPFTVEYREPVALLLGPCSAGSVTVTYDGSTLGTAPLRQQKGDCVATLPATSRGGPGRHDVGIAGTSVATTYTVDPPPTLPTKRAGPASAIPSRSAASATATPNSALSAPPASTSDRPTLPDGRFATASAQAVSMPGPNASGGGSATRWVLAAGGVLILADLCLLALLTVRRRAARSG